MKRVWINGTFDIVHIGHIKLLEYASSLGEVRVGLDTDSRIQEKKGLSRPFNILNNRIHFMLAIRYVHSVVSFDSNEELCQKILEWKPDIMVVGNDYNYHEVVGANLVPRVLFFNKIEGISTSKILGRGKI